MALTQKPHEGGRWVGEAGDGNFPSSERVRNAYQKIGMKLPNKTNLAWLILEKNLKISYLL